MRRWRDGPRYPGYVRADPGPPPWRFWARPIPEPWDKQAQHFFAILCDLDGQQSRFPILWRAQDEDAACAEFIAWQSAPWCTISISFFSDPMPYRFRPGPWFRGFLVLPVEEALQHPTVATAG